MMELIFGNHVKKRLAKGACVDLIVLSIPAEPLVSICRPKLNSGGFFMPECLSPMEVDMERGSRKS